MTAVDTPVAPVLPIVPVAQVSPVRRVEPPLQPPTTSAPAPAASPAQVSHAVRASASADEDPWPRVIEAVRARKPAIQGFLRGSAANLPGDGTLRIEIPAAQSIYLELLQGRDNRRLLAELVEECYGRPLGLRFEAVAGAPAATAAVQPTRTTEGEVDKSAIQRILDLFDGDVLGPS